MPGKNLRVLSLDGGGVRGLSSLLILKTLMETINPEKPPKPCEYFHMIGGTSTGGLVTLTVKDEKTRLTWLG
jgi:patatin-like phospholipase/acyl hydrolase